MANAVKGLTGLAGGLLAQSDFQHPEPQAQVQQHARTVGCPLLSGKLFIRFEWSLAKVLPLGSMYLVPVALTR
jgi:hypothetical protein